MKFEASINPIVNDYIENEVPAHLKELFLSIRSTIQMAVPDLGEDIKWKNCLTYSQKKKLIQTVVGKDKVTLIFLDGIHIPDPNGLLDGDGKKARSVRFYDLQFSKPGLSNLVLEAVKL